MKTKSSIFGKLPPEDLTVSNEDIRMLENRPVIVVLDDDPTGTQTVHDVLLLTKWRDEQLLKALEEPIFYLLTNSRSLDEQVAYELVFSLCKRLLHLAEISGKKLLFVSRSDSTLRGHFKAELAAMKQAIELPQALSVFVPAFFEGGRFTIENIHYVEEGESLIPAAKTPFAKDATFGFTNSELYAYIKEKDDRILNDEIFDLSITEIRTLPVEDLVSKVVSHSSKKALIINAASYADLRKCALVLHRLYAEDYPFVIRSAASLLPALVGIDPIPLIDYQQNGKHSNGGLIVVGSYVPKSTEQLSYLLASNPNLAAVELSVDSLLLEKDSSLVSELVDQLNQFLSEGKDCVFFTSRKLVSGNSPAKSLQIVNAVSRAVVEIVASTSVSPSFIIAKGGITSSDIATKALDIEEATVLGQLLPGVPVWRPSQSARFPETPYVVFPGNVGTKESLHLAYQKVRSHA
ncbi:MAG: four-carbon acid sugar kinase family protein [Bacteroidota bacterium]